MRQNIFLALCVVLLVTSLSAAEEDFAVYEKGGPRPEAPPDKALVYIVRPATLGMAIRLWAFADETPLAVTRGNTYATAEVEPGTHIFWGKAENVSAMEYTVEAGKTYFLKLKVKMGGFKARVRVEFLAEKEGEEALKNCKKYSTFTAAGQERAAVIVGERLDAAKEKVGE